MHIQFEVYYKYSNSYNAIKQDVQALMAQLPNLEVVAVNGVGTDGDYTRGIDLQALGSPLALAQVGSGAARNVAMFSAAAGRSLPSRVACWIEAEVVM